ncbi:hypothetical protein NDU88_005392 [Pleurodeles waltl]|uniref:Uncharacterized protein n=1 Tax=Pleurodeles waltl TaxID=8319 RepID=A0AAV7QH28_PLEWA|nr:hypothetical protein NDU88_005392 [Pleurodeles waltl]
MKGNKVARKVIETIGAYPLLDSEEITKEKLGENEKSEIEKEVKSEEQDVFIEELPIRPSPYNEEAAQSATAPAANKTRTDTEAATESRAPPSYKGTTVSPPIQALMSALPSSGASNASPPETIASIPLSQTIPSVTLLFPTPRPGAIALSLPQQELLASSIEGGQIVTAPLPANPSNTGYTPTKK